MPSQETPLGECLAEIEDRLAWGPSADWTNQDFQQLSDRIATTTEVSLSITTLKRIWGRVAYASQPSTTTLDALARFAGHDNWRHYRREQVVATKRSRFLSPFLIVAVVGAVIVLVALRNETFIAPASPPKTAAPSYAFDLRPVASGVPNSVIFTYDAAAAPTDEVYLQQSWDDRRRRRLPREGNTHASIYYLPGYYRAKLIVADRIVQERELLIPSEDWVVAVDTDPVPVYLQLDKVQKDGKLSVDKNVLERSGIDLAPVPPTVIFTNVGMLEGLSTDDFYFRSRLRHDYAAGAAACREISVIILLKNSAIILPLSAPGCVANLELMAGGRAISGRSTDLSPFGVVGSDWMDIACTGTGRLLTFSIDGHEIYRLESQEEPLEIVGVRYLFTGLGSIDEVAFGNGRGEVWKAEF